jgi:hypothetical protein
MTIFRNILPKTIIRQVDKAVKAGDEGMVRELMRSKIQPIIDDYQARVLSTKYHRGEQLLWYHETKKGIIHREIVARWAITNLRAYKVYSNGQFAAIGLAVTDTVVMNQIRESTGTRTGVFTGVGGRGFAGMSTGVSHSESHSRRPGFLSWRKGGIEIPRHQ